MSKKVLALVTYQPLLLAFFEKDAHADDIQAFEVDLDDLLFVFGDDMHIGADIFTLNKERDTARFYFSGNGSAHIIFVFVPGSGDFTVLVGKLALDVDVETLRAAAQILGEVLSVVRDEIGGPADNFFGGFVLDADAPNTRPPTGKAFKGVFRLFGGRAIRFYRGCVVCLCFGGALGLCVSGKIGEGY